MNTTGRSGTRWTTTHLLWSTPSRLTTSASSPASGWACRQVGRGRERDAPAWTAGWPCGLLRTVAAGPSRGARYPLCAVGLGNGGLAAERSDLGNLLTLRYERPIMVVTGLGGR